MREGWLPRSIWGAMLLGAVCSVAADDSVPNAANNWHQWRGPFASGIAARGNPPIEWSETENVRWKVPVPGQGSTTPIIYGSQVFLLSAIKTDRTTDAPETPRAAEQREGAQTKPAPTHYYQFKVFCFDRHSGEMLWHRTATEVVPHRGHHRDGGYASASPTTDGERLYACFGSQGMYCYDLEGNELWSRDLGMMEIGLDQGECVTPVVHDGTVVLVFDHLAQSVIYGLDAHTGGTRWQRDREEVAGWSTPILAPHDGKVQVIRAGDGSATSYDLATGDLIWRCKGPLEASVTSPVVSDNAVFCMTYYGKPTLLAISLDSKGDVTDAESVLWRYDRDTSWVPSPIILDQTLFVIKESTPILTGFNIQTGEVVTRPQRLRGLSGKIYASPAAVGQRLYITSRGGETLVLQENGDQLEQLAVNKLEDSFDASPAIVGDSLYMRGKEFFYCIGQHDRE